MLKRYKDMGVTTEVIGQVHAESRRQITKWGIQRRTAFEWMAYATEEVGETAQAISEAEYRKGSCLKVAEEAIQAATLLLKIAAIYLRREITR